MCLPTVATDDDPPTADTPSNAPSRKWTCKCCNNNISSKDNRHTREPGGCRYPNVVPDDWQCPACKLHKPRKGKGHTLGEDCKYQESPSGAQVRGQHVRPRQSQRHPRDPQPRVAADPTSHERVDPDPGLDVETIVIDEETSEPASSSTTRRSFRSQGAGGVEDPEGLPSLTDAKTWTMFDLGRALQQLRSDDPGLVKRTLRTLHVRWWHSQAHDMIRILSLAGLPKSVTDQIKPIVDTCRACRDWFRPAATNMSTLRMSTKFNEYVQCDLLFVGDLVILHMIDELSLIHI